MSHLQAGDRAPAIRAKDENGEWITLEEFRGKKVVLYFYPKDDTPGCTAEACDLRDHYAKFLDQGFEVIGVSADNEKSHTRFKNKYKLPFRLISDTDKKVLEDYGAWGEKSTYGRKYMGVLRKTFLIDGQGRIARVWPKVNVSGHAEEVLDAARDL